jgi:lipoprotein NlpI
MHPKSFQFAWLGIIAGWFFGTACVLGEDNTPLLRQAAVVAERGQHTEAIQLLDMLLKREPDHSYALYLRGREQLRIGKIAEAVADLNQHVKLSPKLESRQWERGIAFYYAGEFAAGAKQFEDYQTFHNQDVENSVWRFLCSAKIEGIAKARANMLPIERDPRVPMMEVYELYRGKKTPAEVFAAAQAGMPTADDLKVRMFYANLYVALYYDASGDLKKAQELINQAAAQADVADYMGDIARVHAQHLQQRTAEKAVK